MLRLITLGADVSFANDYQETALELAKLLHHQSIAIADDYGFYLDLKRSLERRGAALNLAQLYATLHSLFGASSTCFDDWKGSFCFPFRLELARDEVVAAYLLHIYDHRAAWYYGMRKIVAAEDPLRRDMIHQPFEHEFSRRAINQVIARLHEIFFVVFTLIKDTDQPPFLQRVDSEHILYGYRDGAFFATQCESPEAYGAARARLDSSGLTCAFNRVPDH